MSIDGLSKKINIKPKKYFSDNKTKKNLKHKFIKKTKLNKNIIWFCFFCIIIGITIILINSSHFLLLPKLLFSGKHLVLFQNNAELRPTGGFIGSFAVIDTKLFNIKNIYIDSNIYKRDNQFTSANSIFAKEKVLREFIEGGKMAMRDSNWNPDFTISAEQISWFYEHEGGSKVDNVIAITSNFFKNILKIIGPINLAKYNIEVDQVNFNELMQKEIEQDYYTNYKNQDVNEPKTIISEMFPIVISRIKNPKYWYDIYNLIYKSLKNKDILLYSFNENLEKEIIRKNYGGQIISTNNDYLLINNANLGATKSSIYINEIINYQVNVDNNKLLADLSINKTHSEENYGKYNKDFTRIYVPKNINLINASINNNSILNELEISEENEKNVIKFTNITQPGETINIKISYYLPDNIFEKSYQLNVQKQPGANNQFIIINILNNKKFEGKLNNDLLINN